MNPSIHDALTKIASLEPYRGESPFERFAPELWYEIDAVIPNYGPQWYRELLGKYPMGGAYLFYPIDLDRDYIGACYLFRPSDFLREVQGKWPMIELFSFGYFAFADGEDGNLWIFEQGDIEDPQVLFLEMSSWGGSIPSLSNGLIDPGLTLSKLLIKCADLTNE